MQAQQFHQPRTLLGLQRFQQGADIGLVQIADQAAQGGDIGPQNGGGNLLDIVGALLNSVLF